MQHKKYYLLVIAMSLSVSALLLITRTMDDSAALWSGSPTVASRISGSLPLNPQNTHNALSAPVRLDYDMPARIQVGDTVTVALEFHSASEFADHMVVEAHMPKELVALGSTRQTYQLSGSQPAHSWELQIHATHPGKLRFGVTVQPYDADGRVLIGRAFAVPVIVAATHKPGTSSSPSPAPDPNQMSRYLKRGPSGDLVIEMPASSP